jgi:hypothetical protein
MDCPNCSQPVVPPDAYCAACGDPVPDEPAKASTFSEADPNPPPSFWEGFVPYFLPFKTNGLKQIRRLGGCPGCGEGRNLDLDSENRGWSFIGQPTGTITCEECGTTLDATASGVEVISGQADIEGQTLSFSECGNYAESRRTGAPVGEVQPPEERLNHITGDYYWDTEVVDDKLWLGAAILCLIPPVGIFFLSFFVFQSITTHPEK